MTTTTSGTISVYVYAQQCTMAGNAAPYGIELDDDGEPVSLDYQRFVGTARELMKMSRSLEAHGNTYAMRTARTIREEVLDADDSSVRLDTAWQIEAGSDVTFATSRDVAAVLDEWCGSKGDSVTVHCLGESVCEYGPSGILELVNGEKV